MSQSVSNYTPAVDRYNHLSYRRCGRSGLRLPVISLGLWHNFGTGDGAGEENNCRRMIFTALDLGITHFDLANNYGPPAGSAEIRMGRLLRELPRRELVISTKAGFRMWPGPYGEWGSRKYLMSSLDESLRRLGTDYVDIFYHHRPDPDTPLEETLQALEDIVRRGKALYVGISNYSPEQTIKAAKTVKKHDWHRLLVNQTPYNMLNRKAEQGLFEACDEAGMGLVAFCPLAQGLLTPRYFDGIPYDSRAAADHGFLKSEQVTDAVLAKARQLAQIAERRGQTLPQMALSWVLRHPIVTSALIGASSPQQITENCKAADKTEFSPQELKEIDAIVEGRGDSPAAAAARGTAS